MWTLEHCLSSTNLSPRGIFQTDIVDMERHFVVALSTTLWVLHVERCTNAFLRRARLWWYVLQILIINSRATHGPVSVCHYSHRTTLTRISSQYDSACLCLGAFFFMCPFVVHGEIVALSAAHFPYRWQIRSGALYHWMTRPIRSKYYSHNNVFLISSNTIAACSIKAASKQLQTFGTKSQSVLSGNRKALN